MPPRVSAELERLICADYAGGAMSIKGIAKRRRTSPATVDRVLARCAVTRDRDTGPHKRLALNEDYFACVDSPEKAYWLGFIVADGYVTKGCDALAIELARRDARHLRTFRAAIGSRHRLAPTQKRDRRTGRVYPASQLIVSRRRFVAHLLRLGVGPNKTRRLAMPTLDSRLVSHFVRGYFDGDGGWTARRGQLCFNVRLSTVTFALAFRAVLVERCNVAANKLDFQNGAFRLAYEGNVQCRRLFEFMYEEVGPRLTRKHRQAERLVGRTTREGDKRCSTTKRTMSGWTTPSSS